MNIFVPLPHSANAAKESLESEHGSHSDEVEEKGDDQFEIADSRNVDEVFAAIKEQGLQPVMNDYVYV